MSNYIYSRSGLREIKSKFVFLAMAMLLAAPAAHAVPNLISYQGQLNDQNGVPINATVSFQFSIYDAPSGGTALWTEAQTLPVSNGIFNVQLGAVTALPSTVFAQDIRYLGIKVGADAEMTPRQRITTSAYSQRAETLTSPVVPVGGIVAWSKSMTGTPALPDGWVECNGQTLLDPASPYNGQTIPNLNVTNRILQGDTSSGSVTTEDFLPAHKHDVHAGSVYYLDAGWGASCDWRTDLVSIVTSGTANTHFHIVWIMRVR